MATTSSRDGGIVGVVWRSSASGGELVMDDDSNILVGGQLVCTKSGAYNFVGSNATTSNTLGNGTMRVVPVTFPKACTLSRIGAEITGAGEAGSVLRLGIYSDSGDFYPGSLLVDAGTIDGTSATVQEITISQAVSPGVYWLAAAVQAAPTTQPTVRVVNTANPMGYVAINSANTGSSSAAVGLTQTSVTGALPSSFSSTISAMAAMPRVFVKVQ